MTREGVRSLIRARQTLKQRQQISGSSARRGRSGGSSSTKGDSDAEKAAKFGSKSGYVIVTTDSGYKRVHVSEVTSEGVYTGGSGGGTVAKDQQAAQQQVQQQAQAAKVQEQEIKQSIPVSQGFMERYRQLEPEIRRIREGEAVTQGQPFLEKTFQPYGKATRTAEELGKFGQLAYRPYGEKSAIFATPISKPERTLEQQLTTEQRPGRAALLTSKIYFKGTKAKIDVLTGAGIGGAIEAGKRIVKGRRGPTKVLGTVGRAAGPIAVGVWGAEKEARILSLQKRGQLTPAKTASILVEFPLEAATFGLGGAIGAGTVRGASAGVRAARIKATELRLAKDVRRDVMVRPKFELEGVSKEVSPYLRVKEVRGFKTVRDVTIKKGKLKEVTKYVPRYGKEQFIKPSELKQPDFYEAGAIARRSGIIRSIRGKRVAPSTKQIVPKSLGKPIERTYDFTKKGRVLVSNKAMADLAKPIITRKVLPTTRRVELRERGILEGVFRGREFSKDYDYFYQYPGRKGDPFAMRVTSQQKQLEQTILKQVGYQRKLTPPKKVEVYKPVITESGEALGTVRYVWDAKTGQWKQKFVTAGRGKVKRPSPFKARKIVEEPTAPIEAGPGGQIQLQMARPKVITGVKLKFKEGPKTKTKQRLRPLSEQQYKSESKTTGTTQEQYYKTSQAQMSKVESEIKKAQKSRSRQRSKSESKIKRATTSITGTAAISKTAQAQRQAQRSKQISAQISKQVSAQLPEKAKTPKDIVDKVSVPKSVLDTFMYRPGVPGRARLPPPELPRTFFRPPTDLKEPKFDFDKPFIKLPPMPRAGYAPTLVGLEFLKPIKGTPELGKKTFTGLLPRPQVKIPSMKKGKRKKKRR